MTLHMNLPKHPPGLSSKPSSAAAPPVMNNNNVIMNGGAGINPLLGNNADISALIANALQNPELNATAQALLQTMNQMNAMNNTKANNTNSNAMMAAPALNNGMMAQINTNCPVPTNNSNGLIIQQQLQQQQMPNFNSGPASGPTNTMAPTPSSVAPAPSNNIIMGINNNNSSAIINPGNIQQFQNQQQVGVQAVSSGSSNSSNSTTIMGNNNALDFNILPTDPLNNNNTVAAPTAPNNNNNAMMSSLVSPPLSATTSTTTGSSPQPPQNNGIYYPSSSAGGGNNNGNSSSSTLMNNNNNPGNNNDFEPSDFRPTNNFCPQQVLQQEQQTVSNTQTTTEDQECLDLLLDNSFLDNSDANTTGGVGNIGNNHTNNGPAVPQTMPVNNNTNVQQQSSQQQERKPPSPHELQMQEHLRQVSQQQMRQLQERKPPSPHSQQMQEHLRQVSQQQMQQFSLQQQLRQQQQANPQLTQQQQQLLQQQSRQSSAMSMQSDLQALEAKVANGEMPANRKNESGQGQGTAGSISNAPLKPSSQKQGQKPKRTARSTSRASHNPRADNSSNWDAPLKKDGPLTGATAAAANSNNSSMSFHYVQVVGGGMKRPAPSRSQVHTIVSGPNNHGVSGGGSSTGCSSTTSQPSQAPKRIRQVSGNSSSASCPSSLQDYLDSMLTSRGYSPQKRPASQLGYRQPPTPLQLASFGFAVCSTIKPNGADRLTALLRSGLSPNPTNKFGDSPFFMACKRGLYPLVKAFVDNGAEVRVADGFGRTPLHYVAWANPPCLESARLLLGASKDAARLLYVMDAHGKTPLDFVGEQHRSRWVEFLESVKDEFWPNCNVKHGVGGSGQSGSVGYFPEERHEDRSGMQDPVGALSVSLAEKVASGHIMPEEAKRLMSQQS